MAQAPVQPLFDRWKPHDGLTIAYQLFRRDMVEVNTFCWNGQGAINHVQQLLAQALSGDEVKTILHYGKDLGRRSQTLVGDARSQFMEVDNWIRLATVIYTASLLELFVRRVVTLALRSDPGLLISRPGIADGVTLLRSGERPDVRHRTQACTEGTWSKREHELQQVFGRRIRAVFENLKDLQAIQDMRNSIAHDFARTAKTKDFWYLDPAQANPQPINRLSADRLQNMLRIVGVVAAEIEHVAIGHIGSFELLLFWHKFLEERRKSKTTIVDNYKKLYKEGGSEKLLSVYHNRMTGRPLGRKYCNELLRYYRKS